MPIVRKKNKKIISKKPAKSDYWLFSSLILATMVLTAAVLIFYVAASVSLRNNTSQENYIPGQGTAMVETLNYNAAQTPQDFPVAMLKGYEGQLISSQEIKNPRLGQLKFVSFKSKDSYPSLTNFYRNYLQSRAYNLVKFPNGEISRIAAYRGKMSFDITVTPQVAGSLVAIYQRIMK